MKAMDKFPWACSVIRDAIESGTWGCVSFSMKDGHITAVKTETTQTPPVDNPKDMA